MKYLFKSSLSLELEKIMLNYCSRSKEDKRKVETIGSKIPCILSVE